MELVNNPDLIQQALYAIKVDDLSRNDWVRVGMALKAEGFECDVWDAWSKTDERGRYHPGECERLWRSFRRDGISGKTILHLAKDGGSLETHALELGATIPGKPKPYTDDVKELYTTLMDVARSTPRPQQLAQYIEAIYKPGDIIGYCVEAAKIQLKDGREKYGPSKAKFISRESLVSKLQSAEGAGLQDIIGAYNPKAGAWICPNPFDGKGQTADNITDYRYVLVECDDLKFVDQFRAYIESQLPIAALVLSGRRSLHAVVHIDAQNEIQYAKRVRFLFDYLAGAKGFPIDQANKNPNRFSRLPGVIRCGNVQALFGTDFGPASYEEFVKVVSGLE